MHDNILYIGSGRSAKLIEKIDLSEYTIVCVNNAWRLFENSKFHVWIHSGDFPNECKPKTKNFNLEISYKQYGKSIDNIVGKLNLHCESPQHYLGYTIFFNGLYWICDTFNPKTISLLGFDHDYNPEKIQKWNENKKPTPQNSFLKPKHQSIKDWSEQFFSGMESDFFYGHGTPDPMRLGMKHLKDKMIQAINNANNLGIQIFNLSPIESEFNQIIPKKMINE